MCGNHRVFVNNSAMSSSSILQKYRQVFKILFGAHVIRSPAKIELSRPRLRVILNLKHHGDFDLLEDLSSCLRRGGAWSDRQLDVEIN